MTFVYGGVFNPPTRAHFLIAEAVMIRYPGNAFYYLPTGNAYHKDAQISSAHRMAMLRLHCLKLGKNAYVSDLEAAESEFTGTYYSLKKFRDPIFIMGSDNLKTIGTWIRYPDIIIENRFIVISRPGVNLESIFEENNILKQYRSHFEIMDFLNIDISSSKYRREKDSKYLLPEVAQYIKENNLYKE